MKKITKELVLSNTGCFDMERVKRLSFMQKETFTFEEFIESELHIFDKLWFLFYAKVISKKELISHMNEAGFLQKHIDHALSAAGIQKQTTEPTAMDNYRNYMEERKLNIYEKLFKIIINKYKEVNL